MGCFVYGHVYRDGIAEVPRVAWPGARDMNDELGAGEPVRQGSDQCLSYGVGS